MPLPPLPQTLLPAARELLTALSSLSSWAEQGPSPGAHARADALLLLETKAVPELETQLGLPLFIGIQGGTNVGKSTLFNALVGKVLSPALVVASATKHPLAYLHESWRGPLLEKRVLRGFKTLELADPKELITGGEAGVLYLRFHDDDRRKGIAWIDSPDFDGALAANALEAERVAALTDVTIFVTTEQKYRDRALILQLDRLLELKDDVILVFNRLEEQVIFETLLDDLRQALGPHGKTLRALRVPPSTARHPEEELRPLLQAEVLDKLGAASASSVKVAVVQRTLRRAAALASEAVNCYSTEARLKAEILRIATAGGEEARASYRKGFQLALPEETLAIRRVLEVTEVSRLLALQPGVEASSGALGLAGAALRQVNEAARRLVVRWSRGDQGTIDATPTGLADYARARNLADAEAVARALEPVRIKVESFVRGREETSPLARQLLRAHFTPKAAAESADAIKARHLVALQAAEGTGEEILPRTEAWLASHPGRRRLLAASALGLKVGLGLLLAWVLPPETGIFGILNPLKWIYFAVGYLAGSYLVALAVSWTLRRRRRFQSVRESLLESTLQAELLAPLESAAESLLSDEGLRRANRATAELVSRLESLPAEHRGGTGSKPEPPKG